MNEGFTTVYAKATGAPHLVPNHYLTNPALMGPFQTTKPGAFDPAVGGNVPATLDWVGDDAARAEQILELEEAAEHPRTSLIDPLVALIESATNPDGGTPPEDNTDTPATGDEE